MEKDYLILKRASASRASGEWNEEDYDVLAGGDVVGRIFKANASPVGASWMWTLAFGHHEDRTPTHGYAATREEAMAAFAKSWRRESIGVAAMISSPLFTSTPIPNGGTATLTTYFGQMLSEAEELYGRRDMNWTPIGVEFFASTVPHIWFPGNRNHVAIRLTLSALNDLNEALWQLAHEIVHILGPVETGKANNLEEGVATRFALNVSHYTDEFRVRLFREKLEQTPYHSALQDCEALLQMDADIIKKLRKQQPYLSRTTAKQILDVLPSCDRALAERLASRFPTSGISIA